MPRFINQTEIPMALRRPHIERYRRMLKESLHNPGLSPEQREDIHRRLAEVGQPKVYGVRASASAVQPARKASAPAAGVKSEPVSGMESSLPDADALDKMTKAEIAAQAEHEGIDGVSTNQTKAVMIETLIAGR